MDIYQKLLELRKQGASCALATVIRTKGSVPREVGAKMIVEISGAIHGTIGGSKVEALVIAEAQQAIHEGKAKNVSHNLMDEEAHDTGMLCGGMMEFFIEPIANTERLYIFGGGHVGYYTAQFASRVGFSCVIVDDRAEFANAERFPDAAEIIVADPGSAARQLNLTLNDYVVIVTRGHKDDYQILKEIIIKPCRYLGMIGSKTKRAEIYSKLREQNGVSDELLKRVHSPIGLSIGAETPEEIAVSIVAEMIQSRRFQRTQ